MELLNYIVWNPDMFAFRIGSWGVRWYSLCWLIGLALGYLLMKKLYEEQGITWQERVQGRKKVKVNVFDPLFIYIFVSVLVGARLGHCIFYEPDRFLTSVQGFVEMLLPIHFLQGGGWKYTGYEGLASHGGVIGMLVAIWLYCRNTKVPLWTVLDNMGICCGVTAGFIRVGNLMNSEIIGKVTDVPWAFIFEQVDKVPRHPGQLYEALAYFAFLAVVLFIYKRRGPESVGTGFYFGLCLTVIFTFRFLIEYTKDIQVAFEAGLPLDMGQILSIPFILIGVACMVGGPWMKRLGAK